MKLDRVTAPWAYARGEPFRAIASLELLGSLLGLMLLVDEVPGGSPFLGGKISVGGNTDNSGNRFAVTKMLTTKWPLLAFLAELSAQLEVRNVLLEVNWVPREENAEADAIKNEDAQWLRKEKRIRKTPGQMPFIVLPELLLRGETFYSGLENINVDCPTREEWGLRKPLRVLDPWG